MVKYWLILLKSLMREKRFLKNVFSSSHKKTALLSYTVTPFLTNNAHHSNAQEARAIAGVLDELGYNVDVIHYTNERKINYEKYGLIFGFGQPFENSFNYSGFKRIYYATGAHVCHQNFAEIRRVNDANHRYSSTLRPKRLVPWCWSQSTSLSDLLIIVGNDWTRSTYSKYTYSPITTINATALVNLQAKKTKRHTDSTRKRYLWFGSLGLIHKGLDLCLEYFSDQPDLELHICGRLEEDFLAVFDQLLALPNVRYHGFIDVDSEQFLGIVSQCSFSILPSCSEGQSTALLTTMGVGLIPLATEYTGVDIKDHGILIEGLDLASIDIAIEKSQLLSRKTLENVSHVLMAVVANKHSLESFRSTLKSIIKRFFDE